DELAVAELQGAAIEKAGNAARQRIGKAQREADGAGGFALFAIEETHRRHAVDQGATAIARGEAGGEEGALAVIEPADRHIERVTQGLLGAVIGMGAPGNVAEERRRP